VEEVRTPLDYQGLEREFNDLKLPISYFSRQQTLIQYFTMFATYVVDSKILNDANLKPPHFQYFLDLFGQIMIYSVSV
jgi:hypothetical protein